MSLNQRRMKIVRNVSILLMLINSLNNKINRTHERVLGVVYRDKKSTFEDLLEKAKSVTVHMNNVQVLVTEMFKVQSNFSPEIAKNVFPMTEAIHNYNHEKHF